MTIEDKIERSKSSERVNFSEISCLNQSDSLVKVEESAKIIVQPIWEIEGDFEGGMYADYISQHPEYDGVYVRSGLYDRLRKAAESLASPYKLVVHAGHRPSAVQKRLLKGVMDDYLRSHPTATKEKALEHARIFISDPDIKLPPHCCGAAVDVQLFNKETDKLVDFGSPVNKDSDISYLHSSKVTAEQKDNRMLLLKTMLEAGFSSYYAEWWHFAYGDEIWAWFYGEESCLYDVIDL